MIAATINQTKLNLGKDFIESKTENRYLGKSGFIKFDNAFKRQDTSNGEGFAGTVFDRRIV
jgi:hypothetical protein